MKMNKCIKWRFDRFNDSLITHETYFGANLVTFRPYLCVLVTVWLHLRLYRSQCSRVMDVCHVLLLAPSFPSPPPPPPPSYYCLLFFQLLVFVIRWYTSTPSSQLDVYLCTEICIYMQVRHAQSHWCRSEAMNVKWIYNNVCLDSNSTIICLAL